MIWFGHYGEILILLCFNYLNYRCITISLSLEVLLVCFMETEVMLCISC